MTNKENGKYKPIDEVSQNVFGVLKKYNGLTPTEKDDFIQIMYPAFIKRK